MTYYETSRQAIALSAVKFSGRLLKEGALVSGTPAVPIGSGFFDADSAGLDFRNNLCYACRDNEKFSIPRRIVGGVIYVCVS
jgi:hypothetical protein